MHQHCTEYRLASPLHSVGWGVGGSPKSGKHPGEANLCVPPSCRQTSRFGSPVAATRSFSSRSCAARFGPAPGAESDPTGLMSVVKKVGGEIEMPRIEDIKGDRYIFRQIGGIPSGVEVLCDEPRGQGARQRHAIDFPDLECDGSADHGNDLSRDSVPRSVRTPAIVPHGTTREVTRGFRSLSRPRGRRIPPPAIRGGAVPVGVLRAGGDAQGTARRHHAGRCLPA